MCEIKDDVSESIDKIVEFQKVTSTNIEWIKYNLWLLSKSIIFASLLNADLEIDEAREQSDKILLSLDSDIKNRILKSVNNE